MSAKNLRVAICGASGRMGRTLLEACASADGVAVTAALERAGHRAIGTRIGLLAGVDLGEVEVRSDLEGVIDDVDTVIDFSSPGATLDRLAVCLARGKQMVIGTTGFTPEQRAALDSASREIAMVVAPNMSVGVNLCLELLEVASAVLGDEVDIEIIEAHHRHKVDAPSGTAIRMGEVVAKALGRDLSKVAVYGRRGHTGERDRQTIGFETVRAGDLVGEHTVMFAGVGERIEITHRASSRMNFALGALRAVRWLHTRASGLYDMRDVLGLR